MTTTTKTIQLEDYYAPTFRVPVVLANKCGVKLRHPHAGYVPLFRTTHPEPWRPSTSQLSERSRRFTKLSRA